MTDEMPERDTRGDDAGTAGDDTAREGTAGSVDSRDESARDSIDEASDESFPASDPPAYRSSTGARPVLPED